MDIEPVLQRRYLNWLYFNISSFFSHVVARGLNIPPLNAHNLFITKFYCLLFIVINNPYI